jgi:hypothetical protein
MNFLAGIVLITAAVLAAIGLVLMSGCATCTPMAKRCHDNKAQLCDGAGREWRTVTDCDDLGFRCECRERCSCLPK